MGLVLTRCSIAADLVADAMCEENFCRLPRETSVPDNRKECLE